MLDQHAIDTLRTIAVAPRQLLIDGQQCDAEDGKSINVISPIDGTIITTIASGSVRDTERAIAAARCAFEDGRWSRQSPEFRKKIMLKWADLIEADALALAVLGVRDNGTEISMAYKAEALGAAATIRYYGEAIDKIYGQIAPTGDANLGLIHHEPVGVVAAIVPWNFPLMIGTWKLGPALAAGNTLVVKPPETASLSLLRIAELALEAGMPAGVLNVVTGPGSVVGETLALSMDVDVMSFTGSGGVGRRLLANSAQSNMKRCYLELGGKSPNIVFADTKDLSDAARVSAAGIFRNSGQVCIAGSRLLVQRSIHDDFVAEVAKHASAMRVGDPLQLSTDSGAVNNAVQLQQNLDFVSTAEKEGGEIRQGGRRILEETGGYYMEPTIVTNVKPNDTLAQKEVFGPVLAVTAFDTDEEAVALANGTDYGLASAVWTRDLSRAHRMVRAIRAGVVHVNTYGGAPTSLPLGGVKQSGNGHDKSLHAFDKFLDLKTAWFKL